MDKQTHSPAHRKGDGKYQQRQTWLAAAEILNLGVKLLGRIHGGVYGRKSTTGRDYKPRSAKSCTRRVNTGQIPTIIIIAFTALHFR